MKDLTYFLQNALSSNIISLIRVGGYSADNYVATTHNQQKYFVKVLHENFDIYVKKLKSVTCILDKNTKIPFRKPIMIDKTNNLILFPYIDGTVLHGTDITHEHCNSIVHNVLSNFAALHPIGLHEHSYELFENLDNNIADIEQLLNETREHKYTDVIHDILSLKRKLIDKYANNQNLVNWIKQSENFVHGDFHNENILFKNNSVVAVIDFELAHRGHLVEDSINFIWFAFLNSDFSNTNLCLAHEFLKLAKDVLKFTETDILNGFMLLYIKLFSSTFLESSLLKYGGDFYAGLLKRDINKFKYIDEHLSEIQNSLKP